MAEQVIIDKSLLTGIGNAIRDKKGTTELIPSVNMESEIRSIGGIVSVAYLPEENKAISENTTINNIVFNCPSNTFNVLEQLTIETTTDSSTGITKGDYIVYSEGGDSLIITKYVETNGNRYVCIINDKGLSFTVFECIKAYRKEYDTKLPFRTKVVLGSSSTVGTQNELIKNMIYTVIGTGDTSLLYLKENNYYKFNGTNYYRISNNFAKSIDASSGFYIDHYDLEGASEIKENAISNFYLGASHLQIPYGVTEIKKNAFSKPVGGIVSKLSVPSSVVSLGEECFRFELEELHLRCPIKTIPKRAFYNARWLSEIKIPETVTVIEEEAFSGATSFAGVDVKLNFPESLTTIKDLAFFDDFYIKSIHIGKNLTNLGKNPFAGCIHLESITIDENNTRFNRFDSATTSNGIFTDNIRRQKILLCACMNTVLPENLVTISDYAYYGVQISELSIPATVNSVLSNALAIGSEINKAVIRFLGATPPTFGENAIGEHVDRIEVPAGSLALYQEALPNFTGTWLEFTN